MKKCESIHSFLDSYRDGSCIIQDSIYLDTLNKINQITPLPSFGSHPIGISYAIVGFGFVEGIQHLILFNYEQVVSLVEEHCSFESFRKTTSELIEFLTLLEIIFQHTKTFEISQQNQLLCLYGMKKFISLIPANLILTLCLFSVNNRKDSLFLFYFHSYFIFFAMPQSPKLLSHFHGIKRKNVLRKFLSFSLTSTARNNNVNLSSLTQSCLTHHNLTILDLLLNEFDLQNPSILCDIHNFCESNDWSEGKATLFSSDIAISTAFKNSLFILPEPILKECLRKNPHLFLF